MATLCERITKALSPPVSRGAALAMAAVVAVVAISIWSYGGRAYRQDGQRWSEGGDLQETDAFMALVNHHQDRDQWQSGPLHPELPAYPKAPPRPEAKAVGEGAPPSDAFNLDYAVPRVSIYSVPNIRPTPVHPGLKDLGDRAQVRAIEAIEQSSTAQAHTWDDLHKALADDAEPGEKDPFLFERVLVATVAKGTKWPPGDRMVWTRTFAQPVNFSFAAYTVASTESETVKVSSVEATNVRKLSADIALTIPGVEGPKLGVTPDSERTVKTTSDISTQYERLGIDIMPSFLRIIRESAAGGDVAGNTTVALSLTKDPVLILKGSNHVDDPSLADPPIDLVVTALTLDDSGKTPSMEVRPIVPLPHCALRAMIWTVYEQRHIQQHNEIYDESRQAVSFIHDADEPRVSDIMGADDVSPFVWSIQVVPKDQRPSTEWVGRSALTASYNNVGEPRQLVFSDYGRAVKLAHWVRTQPKGANLSGYYFNYNPEQGLVVIKQTHDDCKEHDVVRPQPVK